MITYQVEKMLGLVDEITPLFQKHWDEVDLYVDLGMKANWPLYAALEDADRLHCITVRDGETLVGYAVWIVSPSLHFADYTVACNDLLYIEPEYRGAGNSKELLTYSEQILEEADVDVANITMKSYATFTSLAESCDYFLVENVFTKIIG